MSRELDLIIECLEHRVVRNHLGAERNRLYEAKLKAQGRAEGYFRALRMLRPLAKRLKTAG